MTRLDANDSADQDRRTGDATYEAKACLNIQALSVLWASSVLPFQAKHMFENSVAATRARWLYYGQEQIELRSPTIALR